MIGSKDTNSVKIDETNIKHMPNVIEVPLTHLEGHELLALAITVGFSENYKVELRFHFEYKDIQIICFLKYSIDTLLGA